jgi:hypothetical protein
MFLVCFCQARRVQQDKHDTSANQINELFFELPDGIAEDLSAFVSDSTVGEHAKIMADDLSELAGNTLVQQQMSKVAKQLQEIGSDPTVQNHIESMVDALHEVLLDDQIQEQAKVLTQEILAMIANPDDMKLENSFQDRLQALYEIPHIKEILDRFVDTSKALIDTPQMQQTVSDMFQDAGVALIDEGVQEQLWRTVKDLDAMMSDPHVKKHADRIADRMQSMVVADIGNTNAQKQASPKNALASFLVAQRPRLTAPRIRARAEKTDRPRAHDDKKTQEGHETRKPSVDWEDDEYMRWTLRTRMGFMD